MTQNLASEHRPRSFDQVVGHERYIAAFKNMARQEALPGCILIAGPSGVGKTTLARLIAASALCPNLNRETGDPCGTCLDCKASETIQDSANFMHMDGAGSQLKERVEGDLQQFLQAAPLGGARAKVCIADEAQALSIGARNALLTMTENLPKRSMLIMTTTDPQAIDEAILTRSFKINLSALSIEQLIAGVRQKFPQEEVKTLNILAESSNGCMREMWQLYQQVKSFNEPLTEELAAWMTGAASGAEQKNLLNLILSGNLAKLAKTWDRMIAAGRNPSVFVKQLIDLIVQECANDPYAYDWAFMVRQLSHAMVIDSKAAYRHMAFSLIQKPTEAFAVKKESFVHSREKLKRMILDD